MRALPQPRAGPAAAGRAAASLAGSPQLLTGPPRAWPVAGQTTGSKLRSQNESGTAEPAAPGTDGNSFRPSSLPAGGGGGAGSLRVPP